MDDIEPIDATTPIVKEKKTKKKVLVSKSAFNKQITVITKKIDAFSKALNKKANIMYYEEEVRAPHVYDALKKDIIQLKVEYGTIIEAGKRKQPMRYLKPIFVTYLTSHPLADQPVVTPLSKGKGVGSRSTLSKYYYALIKGMERDEDGAVIMDEDFASLVSTLFGEEMTVIPLKMVPRLIALTSYAKIVPLEKDVALWKPLNDYLEPPKVTPPTQPKIRKTKKKDVQEEPDS
jgi:hypothetical protein